MYCTYRYIHVCLFVTSLSTDREKGLFFFLGGQRVWGCMSLVLICFFGVLFLFVTSVETKSELPSQERVLLTIGVLKFLTPAFCAAPHFCFSVAGRR